MRRGWGLALCFFAGAAQGAELRIAADGVLTPLQGMAGGADGGFVAPTGPLVGGQLELGIETTLALELGLGVGYGLALDRPEEGQPERPIHQVRLPFLARGLFDLGWGAFIAGGEVGPMYVRAVSQDEDGQAVTAWGFSLGLVAGIAWHVGDGWSLTAQSGLRLHVLPWVQGVEGGYIDGRTLSGSEIPLRLGLRVHL